MFDGWESWWLLTLKNGGSFEVCCFLFCFLICASKFKTEVFFFKHSQSLLFGGGGEGEWETLPYHHMPWTDLFFRELTIHIYIINLVLMGSNLSKDRVISFVTKKVWSLVSVLNRFLCSIVWFFVKRFETSLRWKMTWGLSMGQLCYLQGQLCEDMTWVKSTEMFWFSSPGFSNLEEFYSNWSCWNTGFGGVPWFWNTNVLAPPQKQGLNNVEYGLI